MKRKLAIILLLATLAMSVLTSCESDGGTSTPDETTAADTAETTVAETVDPLADSLPEMDWDGKTFRLYNSDEYFAGFYTEAMDGDVINDAIYKSVNNVLERFNATMTYTSYGANSAIQTMVLAGDDIFDAVAGHDRTIAQLSLSDMLYNVNEIAYIDLSKPWWPEHTTNSLTIGGKMYLIASSLSVQNVAGASATFFNKERLDDYGIESPYQTVLDGDWTLDLMIELTKDVYEDVNGDGKRDATDFYGFVAQLSSYRIHESFGLQAYVPDDELVIKLDIDKPSTYTFIEKYYSWLYESDGGLMTTADTDYRTYFMGNNALFTFSSIGNAVDHYRYADVEYGIIPMPKVDESQENYTSGTNIVPTAIPVTCVDTDFAGFMIEALSAEGHRTIFPAYFEIALKQKFTTDSESIKMLDIIAETRNVDFGYLYCGSLPLCRIIPNMLNPSNPTKDFASFYAKNKDAEQANIDTILEAFGYKG